MTQRKAQRLAQPRTRNRTAKPKPSEGPQHPGVIVLRVPAEGGEQITIQGFNGIDDLSIPTLLRLAADIKEKGLGE